MSAVIQRFLGLLYCPLLCITLYKYVNTPSICPITLKQLLVSGKESNSFLLPIPKPWEEKCYIVPGVANSLFKGPEKKEGQIF